MFCPQCGKEVLDGDAFCGACGAAIDAVQTPSSDGAANPFAVGSQTSNASGAFDGDAPVVPSNVFSAWKTVFSKYFDGKGRASRTEFWYWQIFLFLIFGIPAIYILVKVLSLAGPAGFEGGDDLFEILRANSSFLGAMAWILIWAFVLLCPNINLFVRRVHDFNASGWLVLLILIPKLGQWVPYVFGFIPGTKGPNKYGPQPMKR